MPSVHAVVVAYNRRELLRAAIQSLLAQSRPVDQIHVIDNASTDGTSTMVRDEFPDVQLHLLDENTGGAGGFAAGLAFATAAGADLVWLMDDDTVATDEALQKLLDARDASRAPLPVLLASRVVWTDGRDHPMNTPRVRPGVSTGERQAATEVGCLPIRSASFVSVLVDVEAVRQVGLPKADFFLWNDDFEFTSRLLRRNRGLYCPSSIVVHHTRTFGSVDADPGERFYYEVRNKVWTFFRSDGLSPSEKVLYGGSTLRRWARTFAASEHRGVLWSGLRRGLKEGVTRAPRPSSVVLSEAGVDVVDPSEAP
ncbi:MAG TPA: glycosyltransferase [Actinomycetes bacterium]|nr:glycosyltransferase [Actinomycetes bacterium]